MVGEAHPGFHRFRALVEHDLEASRGKGTPREHMRRLARTHPDPDVRLRADVYVAWLEGITDRWLYDQTSILGNLLKISPFCYADRILRRGLPRIRAKVTNGAEEAKVAKVVHEIWTPGRADVRSTVVRIWGADHREELITEAEWFEEQARPHLLRVAILDRIAGSMKAARIRGPPEA